MLFARPLFIAVVLASPMTLAADDPCEVYDVVAKAAMESRQKGKNLSKALAYIDKKVSTTTNSSELQTYAAMRLAFVEAYKLPRFSTESMKADAISDFRNDFYSGCLRATAEQKAN